LELALDEPGNSREIHDFLTIFGLKSGKICLDASIHGSNSSHISHILGYCSIYYLLSAARLHVRAKIRILALSSTVFRWDFGLSWA